MWGVVGGLPFVLTLGVHSIPPPVTWQSEVAGRELALGQTAELGAAAWWDHSFGEQGDVWGSSPQPTGGGRCRRLSTLGFWGRSVTAPGHPADRA